MDLSELKDDPDELYLNRSSYWVPYIPYFENPRSKIVWNLGPIFTERETYGDDDTARAYVTETCGTCVVTQAKGPTLGFGHCEDTDAVGHTVYYVVSTYLFNSNANFVVSRIPNDPQNPSATKPVRASARVRREFSNHRKLTQLGCECIPKLLDYVLLCREKEEPLPGGFLSFLVMERLPGRNLVNFADLPMSERNQVRLAFAKAIREFYTLRFRHNDPHRRNLMWDPKNKKCYIIDLEDACVIDDDEEPKKFKPALTYRIWGIAGPEINCSMYGLDPMVPRLPKGDEPLLEDPGDEALEKMAADAEGKELVFGN